MIIDGYGGVGGGGLDHTVLCIQDPDDPEHCIEPAVASHPATFDDGDVAPARSPDAPHAIVDVGSYMRHFADPGMKSNLPSPFHLGVPAGGSNIDHGMSAVIRAGFSKPHVYGLAEVEIGGLTSQLQSEMSVSNLSVTSLGYAGVVGLAEPIGHSRIAIEGAFGARTLVYTVNNEQSATATAPVVEARVRAETWLTPWLTVGGIAGASVIEKSDWMAGVTIGFHSTAYAGAR